MNTGHRSCVLCWHQLAQGFQLVLVLDNFIEAAVGRAVLHLRRSRRCVQETAEFQERYAHTVVYRMLYMLDRTEKGVLTLADLKRGRLASAMSQLDTEEDINKVLRFFSYEHFYVMYCKVPPPSHCSACSPVVCRPLLTWCVATVGRHGQSVCACHSMQRAQACAGSPPGVSRCAVCFTWTPPGL